MDSLTPRAAQICCRFNSLIAASPIDSSHLKSIWLCACACAAMSVQPCHFKLLLPIPNIDDPRPDRAKRSVGDINDVPPGVAGPV